MSDDEKRIFDNALILILKEHHERLDAAVAEVDGWPSDLTATEIIRHFKQGKKAIPQR